ncbi:MAG: LPS-assembly lipoprotein [Pseudohongiellaceae bacterium]|jgi:LPS-assembly lipoprotein
MLKATTHLITLCVIILMSGCGFQLRGNIDFPTGVEPISIHAQNPYSNFTVALKNSLSSQQVNIASLPKKSATSIANLPPSSKTTTLTTDGFQIHILSRNKERRTLTLGAGATVAEYQLIEDVTFDLRNPNGKVVMGPITVSERKTIPNDPDKVVSTDQEANITSHEMLQVLAQKLARQVSRFNFEQALNILAQQDKQPQA